MDTTSIIEAVKSELPNTRKRLSRTTYRNYIINNNRHATTALQQRQLEKTDPHYIQTNRVTEKLHMPSQQKVLMDLRKYAYDGNPSIVRAAALKEQCGYVKPKCEALLAEMQETADSSATKQPFQEVQKTDAELHQQVEQERGWIRLHNSKLYDSQL